MDYVHVANVAEAAAAALFDALETWQKEHAKDVEVRDLLANELREYTLQIKAFNSAATTVTVELKAAKAHNDEAYIYQLRKRNGKTEIRVHVSKPTA